MLQWKKACSLVAGLAATFAITACESPDVEGRFNDYSELVGEGTPGPAGFCNTQTPLGEGTYLLRLQHTINKNRNIYFEVEVTQADGDAYDISFQPLKSDEQKGTADPRPDGRSPIGDPIVLTGLIPDSEGIVTLSADRVIVPAEANSTTYGEIEADLELKFAFCDTQVYCGKGVMEVYRPIALGGVIANFGSVKVEQGSDYKGIDVPLSCP